MTRFISDWLPIIVAIEGFVAGIAMLLCGRWGSAIYWLSACAITIGVILAPKYG